jgi:hypothetical protein
MGYTLHITRAADWGDSETVPITRDEWEALARADPRLIEAGSIEWSDEATGRVFVWRRPSGPSLYWRRGQVSIDGVESDSELSELVAIALQLGGALMGDDGETY